MVYLEGCDSIFDNPLSFSVSSMDKHLHVHVICNREATIDGSGSRTPVFMKFKRTLQLHLFNRPAASSHCFAKKPRFMGNARSLEHPLHMQGPGVQVVAVVPAAGPVPPPIIVVSRSKPSSICCGQIKWTWTSMPRQ